MMSTLVGAPRLSECCYQPRSVGGTLVTAHVLEWSFDEKCCRFTFKECQPTCIFVCDQEQNAGSAIIAQHILEAGKNAAGNNAAGKNAAGKNADYVDPKLAEYERLLKLAKNGLLQVVITGRTPVTPPCSPPA
jgi:hypothetical protein